MERRGRYSGSMYPLKKGKFASQAHVGLPEGTYEEEHGRKGFYGKSAHLYHTHPPTDWIRFEGKLRPHCLDLNRLHPCDQDNPEGSPIAFLGNDEDDAPATPVRDGCAIDGDREFCETGAFDQ